MATGYIYPIKAQPHNFLLHTYLVGETVIKETVFCYPSSALHIVEARIVELSSGISSAQFLLVSSP